MFKFYLDENFRLAGAPDIPAQFVQYSTVDVEVHAPFESTGTVIIMSVIRPDGFKTNEMFMEVVGQDPNDPNIYIYKTTLTPYHTAIIPGTQSQGVMIVGFMIKQFENNVLVNVLSSPITKITVERSIEPNAEFIPTSVAEDLAARLSDVETVAFDHTLLSAFSRAQANQHPIGAITDLAPKVNVHVGRYEPEVESDTWLDTRSIGEDEIEISGQFFTIVSTPVIALNVTFAINLTGEIGVPIDSLIRLTVVGSDDGEAVVQHFFNAPNNFISGTAFIFQEPNFDDASVFFVLEPIIDGNFIVGYKTVVFDNVGGLIIQNFQALALEVFE